jgi:hypothetical protein
MDEIKTEFKVIVEQGKENDNANYALVTLSCDPLKRFAKWETIHEYLKKSRCCFYNITELKRGVMVSSLTDFYVGWATLHEDNCMARTTLGHTLVITRHGKDNEITDCNLEDLQFVQLKRQQQGWHLDALKDKSYRKVILPVTSDKEGNLVIATGPEQMGVEDAPTSSNCRCM